MRLLGIDYGLRRTGVAVADTESRLALPFEAFEGLTDGQLATAIAELASREGVEAIVVGLPLNADGTVSGQSRLTERFIAALKKAIEGKTGATKKGRCVAIHRASEYLSTHEAEGKLAGHYTRGQKRARVDALAAARILQDWIEGQAKS
jgi:putative holliday junction resolvase